MPRACGAELSVTIDWREEMGITYGTAGNLVVFAVVVFVVRDGSISHHGHYVGKYDTRSLVLVCIDKDTEAFELVGGAEDRTRGSALFGKPDGHAIAVEVALAVDLEFHFNLLVSQLGATVGIVVKGDRPPNSLP